MLTLKNANRHSFYRYKQYLEEEEMISKDNLLDRCQYNPFYRDRVPIISQTYNSRKTVRLLLLIASLFYFILFYFTTDCN